MSSSSLSRRSFLQSVAAGVAVAPFARVAPRVAGTTLRHASIGASGQALSDLKAFATHPAFGLVAVADVDLCRFEALQAAFPKARVYQDWRELLAEEAKSIDSVNVSVPDHMHFPIAMEAMKRSWPARRTRSAAQVRSQTDTSCRDSRGAPGELVVITTAT